MCAPSRLAKTSLRDLPATEFEDLIKLIRKEAETKHSLLRTAQLIQIRLFRISRAACAEAAVSNSSSRELCTK